MIARLEGTKEGPAPSTIAGDGQGDNLCMRLAGALVPALADHLAIGGQDDGAHERIRGNQTAALGCEFQRSPDIRFVVHDEPFPERGGQCGAHADAKHERPPSAA
jgi:hypothetical protein